MTCKDIENFKYAVEVKLLKRFYQLYEEGKKKGTPSGFIEYFSASHFLINEIQKALLYQDKESRKKFLDEFNIPDEYQIENLIKKQDNLKKSIKNKEVLYLSEETGNIITEEDYLNFEEWSSSVAKPEGSSIEKFIKINLKNI